MGLLFKKQKTALQSFFLSSMVCLLTCQVLFYICYFISCIIKIQNSKKKCGVEERRKCLCVLEQVTYLPDCSVLSCGMGFKLRNCSTYFTHLFHLNYGIQVTWCVVLHSSVHSTNMYFVGEIARAIK